MDAVLWPTSTCLLGACASLIWAFLLGALPHPQSPNRKPQEATLFPHALATRHGVAHALGASHRAERHRASSGGRTAANGSAGGSTREDPDAPAHRAGSGRGGRRATATDA